jgi:hypothetical protein
LQSKFICAIKGKISCSKCFKTHLYEHIEIFEKFSSVLPGIPVKQEKGEMGSGGRRKGWRDKRGMD